MPTDPCTYPDSGGCPGGYSPEGNCCVPQESPIVFDLSGDGFHFTNTERGVWFRPYPKRTSEYKVAWPQAESKNGWLVLDRNGNGLIDDFGEMFGNETLQPAPGPNQHRNGFAALAVFDTPEYGGDGDGWITQKDAIYDKLRVWVDSNHDGISQPNELLTLQQAGIAAIELQYHYAKYVDKNGNTFRYRSAIRDTSGSETNKTDWDVFVNIGAARETETSLAVRAQDAFSRIDIPRQNRLNRTILHEIVIAGLEDK